MSEGVKMNKLFRTIKVENKTPLKGHITGEIPSWVKGSLYRNGPGMFEIGQAKFRHWFDGMAMLQRFNICDKKITYQNRFLRSDAYNRNMAAQKIVVSEFGTMKSADPSLSFFKRLAKRWFVPLELTDNCLVSIYPVRDELYTATEGRWVHKVDPLTLESLEKVDLLDCVGVEQATTHPHWDPDGTLHNIGISFKDRPRMCIVKIPSKKEPSAGFPKGKLVSAIPSDYRFKWNYAHSFGMTENYYVIVQQPLFFSLINFMANHIRGKGLCESLKWKGDIKNRFRIIDKRTGEEINSAIRYESNSFLVFHHINAFEENDHIVVDVIAAKPESSFIERHYMKNLTSEDCTFGINGLDDPETRRYVLPLNVRSNAACGENLVTVSDTKASAIWQGSGHVLCTHEFLSKIGIEFPQINYGYNTKMYRYAYGVGFHRQGPVYNTVCKIDVKKKESVEWKEENCYPSEPVFVANPGGTDEDDGVLLSAVNRIDFDEGNNAFLLVLDAKTMQEIARAEFNIPRFPKDFHGLFHST